MKTIGKTTFWALAPKGKNEDDPSRYVTISKLESEKWNVKVKDGK